MIKIFCNRCGKEIEETTYYTVHIGVEDINPTHCYGISAETEIRNLSNTLIGLKMRPLYCKECKDKIEAFINNA